MEVVNHQKASHTIIPTSLNSELVAAVKIQVLAYLLQFALPKSKRITIRAPQGK
jgi:hypothetical protein